MKTTIKQAKKHLNQEVTIGAWLTNKRSSGKIAFLQLRDGTGFMQGVVVKSEVDEETFQTSKRYYSRIIFIYHRNDYRR